MVFIAALGLLLSLSDYRHNIRTVGCCKLLSLAVLAIASFVGANVMDANSVKRGGVCGNKLSTSATGLGQPCYTRLRSH